MKNVVIYICVSSLDRKNGLASQKRAIQRWLAGHSIKKAIWHEDRISGTTDKRPGLKESTRRTMAELKASMLSPNPTLLEQLAVGRVVACWLFAHIVDRRVAHAINDGRHVTGLPKLLEASEKRLQTAMKSLKLVRGMKI